MDNLPIKKEYFKWNYADFDAFVNEYFGFEDYSFECVASEEWNNDSEHSFSIKKTDFEKNIREEYYRKVWDIFIESKGHKYQYMVNAILEKLCFDGAIKEGNYLITVFW